MAAANSDVQAPAPTDSRLHLFELPPELFDLMIGFAYNRSHEVYPTWREAWDKRELRKAWRMAGQVGMRNQSKAFCRNQHNECKQPHIRPFPDPEVSKFMVCKAFFVKAAEAYMASGPINLRFELGKKLWSDSMSIIGAFAKDLVGVLEDRIYLPPMEKLETLRLSVNEDFFEDHIAVWKRSITREAFEQARTVSVAIHGANENVKLELSPYHHDVEDEDPEAVALYTRNIEMLQSVLQEQISSGHSANGPWSPLPSQALYGPTQLYPGFKVTFDVSPTQADSSKAVQK